MKIGDNIQLKADGRLGRIVGMEFDDASTSYTGRFIIQLENPPAEMTVMPMDIKKVWDKKKKREELMKMVRKGASK